MYKYRLCFSGFVVVRGKKKEIKDDFEARLETLLLSSKKNSLTYSIEKEVDK